jgi:hypothetical protein
MARIVGFTCDRGHLTYCDVDITNRFRVEACTTCGQIVNVWDHARFAHVQPDAINRTSIPNHVPNNLGAGDAVEETRAMVKAAHAAAEAQPPETRSLRRNALDSSPDLPSDGDWVA